MHLQLNPLPFGELAAAPTRPLRRPGVHRPTTGCGAPRGRRWHRAGRSTPRGSSSTFSSGRPRSVGDVEDVRDDGQVGGGAGQPDVDIAEGRRVRGGGRRADQAKDDADEEDSHRAAAVERYYRTSAGGHGIVTARSPPACESLIAEDPSHRGQFPDRGAGDGDDAAHHARAARHLHDRHGSGPDAARPPRRPRTADPAASFSRSG